jgi:hypothetical protein
MFVRVERVAVTVMVKVILCGNSPLSKGPEGSAVFSTSIYRDSEGKSAGASGTTYAPELIIKITKATITGIIIMATINQVATAATELVIIKITPEKKAATEVPIVAAPTKLTAATAPNPAPKIISGRLPRKSPPAKSNPPIMANFFFLSSFPKTKSVILETAFFNAPIIFAPISVAIKAMILPMTGIAELTVCIVA